MSRVELRRKAKTELVMVICSVMDKYQLTHREITSLLAHELRAWQAQIKVPSAPRTRQKAA